ncbi:hypothetical protein Bpfe_009628 [Biomphalaria pfeifferi]|uniref:Uncharacterized protein n=1 Tax=Biomphalaria pfeifferi TaxID=112525 RepID=A0AAD8FE60_BIOPF|nr:hypothetical protein Bpfe_009628 [Biomphalaria pfeifferi]
MHSRKDTKFLPWSPGEPNACWSPDEPNACWSPGEPNACWSPGEHNAGDDQNCACMDRDLNFKYVDGYWLQPRSNL